MLVEVVSCRFRGHSMPDPEEYRRKEEVARWREWDPILAFGDLLVREGVIDERERAEIEEQALARVDAAVAFAEDSPFPAPQTLYDDVYVLDESVRGSYSVRTTDHEFVPRERAAAEGSEQVPQQISDALILGEEAS